VSRKKKAQKAETPKNKRGKSRNRGNRTKKVDPVKYWGAHDALPAPSEHVTSSPSPVAAVDSLGRPPIPGHENAAKHYFSLVYERSANLAVALAAAGGLSEWESHPLGPAQPDEGAEEANEAQPDALDDETASSPDEA